jgi:hypothetical protein
MEEMRVKVQSSVVNARDGSRAAIRPERVKDGAAVVVGVWARVCCPTKMMVGLTWHAFASKSGRNQAQEVELQVTIGKSHEVA